MELIGEHMSGSVRRVAFRNATWAALSNAVDVSLVLAYTVLLARVLGPAGYGLFAMAWGLALVTILIVDLGTSLWMVRACATGRLTSGEVVSLACGKTLVSGVAVVCAASLGVLPVFHGTLGMLLVLLLISEGVGGLTIIATSILRGKNRFEAVLAVSAVDKGTAVAGFVLMTTMYGTTEMTPEFAGQIFVVARLVAMVFAVILAWPAMTGLPRTAPSWARFAGTYRAAGTLGSFLLVERGTYGLIPTVVGVVAGAATAGAFQATLKIVMAPLSLISAVAASLYPVFADGMVRDRATVQGMFHDSLRVALTASAVVCAVLAGAPAAVLRLVYGEQYAIAASHALLFLAPLVGIGALWQLCLYFYCAQGRESTALRTSLVSAAIMMPLILLLGKPLGATGCSIALVGGVGTGVALYWREAGERGYVAKLGQLVLPPLLSAFVGVVALRVLIMLPAAPQNLMAVCAVVVALGLVPGVLLLLGYMSLGELARVGGMLRNRGSQ